jgi:two-component system response regulator RegA
MEQLLLVDDDEMLRERMGRALRARDFEVVEASNYDEAVEAIAQQQPHRAVLDLKMPGGSGLALLKLLREESPQTRVVMLTGYGSISNAVDAMREGAVGYVTKPADADQVLAAFDAQPALHADTTEEDFQPPSLAEAEWNHIQQVLADCGGNLSRAANLLGIPRRTLQRKLKKLAP